MTVVLAPLAGRRLPLAEVPDPVFSAEMVGPGVALDPGRPDAPLTVVSPVAGRLLKVHPHAFVVLTDDGVGVLVHLGLDTVGLDGQGFEVLAEQGGTVAAGDPVTRWDVGVALDAGLSAVVPVVVMDRPAGSLDVVTSGDAAAGDRLFTA